MNANFAQLIFHSEFSEISLHETEYVFEWIEKQRKAIDVKIEVVSLEQLTKWNFDKKIGKISHITNQFFSIEGIEVHTNWGSINKWKQPIINQPEIGILGILCKKINGVMHFLLQAKIEPGNVNIIQLSPTVQATKSNFTRVHEGKAPKFLRYFQNIENKNLIVDQLQSEQGARFLKKRNRNLVVFANIEEIPEEFIWLTLNQIRKLLRIPNLINMDTRTVLSGISYSFDELDNLKDLDSTNNITSSLLKSAQLNKGEINSIFNISSFITQLKFQFDLNIKNCNLLDLEEWKYDNYKIFHNENKYFEVIGVDVLIENREVSTWSQPMIKPCNSGICAFILKEINGIIHFLVQAKIECGNFDIIEFAPTVQCITGDYKNPNYEVPFLEFVLNKKGFKKVLFDNNLSEEGGRFYHDINRNIMIIADDDFDEKLPDRYIWLTLYQVNSFIKYNNYFNIQARSLISTLLYE